MRHFSGFALFALSLLFSPAALPQTAQAPTVSARDPQATAALMQSLRAASNGSQLAAPIKDFRASGTITYFSAGQEVSGTATVRGRSPDQFRLDAELPLGTRSVALSHGRGKLRETSGQLSSIPYPNTLNLGIMTYPYPTLAAALGEPWTSVTYLGVAEVSGRPVRQIRVRRSKDAAGSLSNFMTTDYFLDSQTSLILRVDDKDHPPNNFRVDYPREVELSNYEIISGFAFPMTVSEKLSGSLIWRLRLDSVNFNAGLTDSDFDIE